MISIALYQPEIPQNTGNIARLAVGLDIDLYLIGKLGFSLDDRYLKRAGLDYWEHLKLTICKDMEEFERLTAGRRKILGTTKGAAPYYEFEYQDGDIIILGQESCGLPKEYLMANLETSVTIPMPGKVRSLNLSNSAAILAYDALGRTGYFEGFQKNRNYFTEL
ncbi:MAG: tRNA (cytidine(34)-2'-O)-methyltransferase [Spirochaetales bacterium]|nr:tRNA (cytidine(34)-2'-O)-methyltransferase [Spirochaetales bacterium]MBQ2295472.1 tRNA (cytidine(34)-2'-O)-methyltransferase [Spirochaetales bacterium]